jgi:hypothetical protein
VLLTDDTRALFRERGEEVKRGGNAEIPDHSFLVPFLLTDWLKLPTLYILVPHYTLQLLLYYNNSRFASCAGPFPCNVKIGSSLFPVGRLLGGFGLLSAALRLIKVESDINGILPAGGGPLPFISFLP